MFGMPHYGVLNLGWCSLLLHHHSQFILENSDPSHMLYYTWIIQHITRRSKRMVYRFCAAREVVFKLRLRGRMRHFACLYFALGALFLPLMLVTIRPTNTNDGALFLHLMPKRHCLLPMIPGHFLLQMATVQPPKLWRTVIWLFLFRKFGDLWAKGIHCGGGIWEEGGTYLSLC